MKKFSTLLSLMLSGGMIFAQSQRLTLIEEFTQASCPPCAAQNPALNALLDANTTKVVSIKYQTSWPGVDPMNAQTASEVATRVSYYGVTGVPNIEFDGNVLSNAAPSALTQSGIDNQYAVTSPFTINMTHVYNADYSAATVNIEVTCTQAVNGTLKLRAALVEKEIIFDNAPGSNGETEFFSVMRKMLPDASGETLPTSWTVGQTQTFSYQVSTPTYIYDKNQIGFVCFIQNDANKSVLQAGYSAPQPLMNNAAVTGLTGVPLIQCATSFNPTVTIKNNGNTPLTTATINYQIDGGTAVTLPWSGSLAPGQTATQAIGVVNSTPGSHVFKAYITNPNGTAVFNTQFDSQQQNFSILSNIGAAAPVVEAYANTTFPPAGWVLDNADQGPTWTRKTGAGAFSTTACAKMDFYNSAAGNVDELYMPNANMTLSATSATLEFSVAYASYAGEADQLDVLVSTNCGTSWTNVFSKSGANLATAANTTASFTPTATQWRFESVNMTPYLNQTNVLVKFKATSAYGNNLYIDEINLHGGASTAGISNLTAVNGFNVFPNPVNNAATLTISTIKTEKVTVDVVDMLGNVLMSRDLGAINGDYRMELDATNWNAGLYFVNVRTAQGTATKKINVIK